MKNATWKSKLLSLLIMLTMLVGMVPLSGIVSFAVEGAADCEHVDNNTNGKCDNCDEFLSDPSGEILLGEQRTENMPYNVNGFLYLTFTPSETGTYEIKALESSGNPFVYVYDSEGNLIVFDDDSAGDFKFHAVCELTAGTTYYIAFSDSGMNNVCTFVVTKKCDVHIPEGERNCLGILCSVCGEYYGEAGAHSTTAEGDKAATCVSPAYCSVCESEYGVIDPDNHDSSTIDENGKCACEEIFAAGVDGVLYTTMDQALDAWRDGTTLTLYSDVENAPEIELTEGSFTLDLNGHKYSRFDILFKVGANAELTVMDSTDGLGMLQLTGPNDYLILVYGIFNLMSGTVTSPSTYNHTIFAVEGSIINIFGGTIENTGDFNQAMYAVGNNVNIAGGTIGDIQLFSANLTVSNDAWIDSIYYGEGTIDLSDATNVDGLEIKVDYATITVGTELILPEGMQLQIKTIPVDNLSEYKIGTVSHPHSGGTATCDMPAICDTCEKPYGTKPDHSFIGDSCFTCGQTATMIVTDGFETYYALDASSLNIAVTSILNSDVRTFTVDLPANAEAELFTAIRRAIVDHPNVDDGTIHLTIKGATAIPDHDEIDYSTAIFGRLFEGDEAVEELASISLPDVLTVGDNAFLSCQNLTSLYAPKLQEIGRYAFSECGLISLYLPEVRKIEYAGFYYCTNLTSAKLPAAVDIGNMAFSRTALTYLELTSPENIFIDEYALGYPETFSTNVDIVIDCDKADEITGTTWNGFSFYSIKFGHTSGDDYVPTADGKAHENFCVKCGDVASTEDHSIISETGKCVCGVDMAVAKLVILVDSEYFATAEDVFAKAISLEKGTIIIFKDAVLDTDLIIPEYDNISLIVNPGVTLTLNRYFYFNGDIYGGGTIFGNQQLSYITTYDSGTIISGEFTNLEDNSGTIEGGIFKSNFENYGVINGGMFDGTVSNVYKWGKKGEINGGIFNGEVHNIGSTIYGGVFNNKVTNEPKVEIDYFGDEIYYDGSIINTSIPTKFVLGENFSLENSSVLNCTSHLYESSVCRLCLEICTHASSTDEDCTHPEYCPDCEWVDPDYVPHHIWNEGEVTKEPNCTEKGEITYTCLRDESHTYTEETDIDESAHEWNEGIVNSEANCSVPGTKTYTCLNDPSHTHTEKIALDPDAHDWNDGVMTKQPTCAEHGVIIYTCENDPSHTHTEKTALDPDAHDWNDGVVTKQPTCAERGVITYTCENDHSHTYVEIIDTIEHNWSQVNGSYMICTTCGDDYCDHMCHKGGIYAIIWDIYEFIYNLFGIETECDCGEPH